MFDSKVIFLLLGLVLVLALPLAVIWALNVLFPALAIPYTWETWLAVIIISSIFNSSSYKK